MLFLGRPSWQLLLSGRPLRDASVTTRPAAAGVCARLRARSDRGRRCAALHSAAHGQDATLPPVRPLSHSQSASREAATALLTCFTGALAKRTNQVNARV
ncbi:hypothetical protein [Tunicatimonas pelagia]|uniref:hypothetical protein n=1 Tax=Tunicatimonas pelagia TaxID=931531 RepID=UPI0026656A1E|nr:hypothetical protein [Tunicatimonas pelagia]WKN45298.1 hypothetical protein P0M28_10040 [Tunicatimonas pelagia]WKN45307.1 hypothetical protein P0M28_10085 [Tunicatimonas pelagia]